MEDCLKMNFKLIKDALIICLIQYFEADFLWKVSLKILNSGIILKTLDHVINHSIINFLIFKTKTYVVGPTMRRLLEFSITHSYLEAWSFKEVKACLTQNARLIRLAIRVNHTYNRTNRGLILVTLGPFQCICESRV